MKFQTGDMVNIFWKEGDYTACITHTTIKKAIRNNPHRIIKADVWGAGWYELEGSNLGWPESMLRPLSPKWRM